MTECDKCKKLRISWKHGMCPCKCHLEKKWLPDISGSVAFYRSHFNSDLGRKKYDECLESLRKTNEILGAEYRVKLTGDLWADMESLDKAQYRYRQDYTDRHE